jgi:hypothetical protein
VALAEWQRRRNSACQCCGSIEPRFNNATKGSPAIVPGFLCSEQANAQAKREMLTAERP